MQNKFLNFSILIFCYLLVIVCQQQSRQNRGSKTPSADDMTKNSQTNTQTGQQTTDGTNTIQNGTRPDVNTVMVIDDGFDINHDVLKGKIVANYTIACKEEPDSEDTTDVEKLKKKFIEDYTKVETDCELKDGITLKKSPSFSSILQYRDDWNKSILQKTQANVPSYQQDIMKTILFGEEGYLYHGTATAGIIAYKNPGAKLVLVHRDLLSPNDTSNEVKCYDKANLEAELAALSDPDVENAYINSPLSSYDKAVLTIATKHNVTIINMSLGTNARIALEEMMRQKGCSYTNLKPTFQKYGELEEKRLKHRHEVNFYANYIAFLTIQSAGNDGAEINDWSDTFEYCPIDKTNSDHIMVGAYDFYESIGRFSNTGNCVDVYSLGAKVITAAPDNFLLVQNGTSFSSPIVARYVSLSYSAKQYPQEIVKALKEAVDSRKFLPQSTFPREISAENLDDKIDEYKLTNILSAIRQTKQGYDWYLVRKKLRK